jgi:hypothetical protein
MPNIVGIQRICSLSCANGVCAPPQCKVSTIGTPSTSLSLTHAAPLAVTRKSPCSPGKPRKRTAKNSKRKGKGQKTQGKKRRGHRAKKTQRRRASNNLRPS